MPWQLIYTSAPRGLTSGHSGFCTVARSADLREAVCVRLEQISSYHHLNVSSGVTRNPRIAAYRILDIRGGKYYALTRIQSCGLDFTARTNHLAQHLVFQAEDLPRLPSPAAILRHWTGWLASWEGEPRFLGSLSIEAFLCVPAPSWPARNWRELTGDAGRAAGLLETDQGRGCYLVCPPGSEPRLLDLFGESLQLLDPIGKFPSRPWLHPFTTFLQGEDVPSDFQWRGCQEDTPAHEQARRRSAPLLTLQSVPVPNNYLAKLAREGPKVPASAPAGPPPVRLKRELGWKPPSALRSTPEVPRAFTTRTPPPSRRPTLPLLSVSPSFLRRAGVVAVLALLALGIISRLRLWPGAKIESVPGSVGPGAVGSNLARATPRQPAAPLPTPSAVPSRREAPAEPRKPELALDENFPDLPTYLFVVPAIEAGGIAWTLLDRVEPLDQLLNRMSSLDLTARDILMRCCNDNWGLPVAIPMTINSHSNERNLSAHISTNYEAEFDEPELLFDYRGLSDTQAQRQPVRMQARFSRPRKAFSVRFDASGTSKPLDPFRLLVVSAANPPAHLNLGRHFLNLATPSLPEVFQDPLKTRLQKVVLSPGWRWQLRPRVRNSDTLPSGDLYERLPSGKAAPPEPENWYDLIEIRRLLVAELVGLTNREADFRTRASTLEGKVRTNLDYYLPLGKWFKAATNQGLDTFAEFVKPQAGSNAPPERYLEYLNELATNAPPELTWLKTWSMPPRRQDSAAEITKRLVGLHQLCLEHLAALDAIQLIVEGPATNYFQAVWDNLRIEADRRGLLQGKALADRDIEALSERLRRLPKTVDQFAGVSLYLVKLNLDRLERIEVIRFEDSPSRP